MPAQAEAGMCVIGDARRAARAGIRAVSCRPACLRSRIRHAPAASNAPGGDGREMAQGTANRARARASRAARPQTQCRTNARCVRAWTMRSAVDGKTADAREAEPQRLRMAAETVSASACIPFAGGDVDAHAVVLRVAHELGRCVEAHRQRVEQGAGEGGRMVALQPPKPRPDGRSCGRGFRETQSDPLICPEDTLWLRLS